MDAVAHADKITTPDSVFRADSKHAGSKHDNASPPWASNDAKATAKNDDYSNRADDCPRLTGTRVWAENWTGINGVPNEVVTEYLVEGDAHVVTAPDGTVYKEFYAGSAGFQPASVWAKGLLAQSEVWSGGVRQKWTTTAWTQNNTSVTYQTNPRITETSVYDGTNQRRTTVAYASFTLPSGSSCHLLSDTREYAANATTVLRRSHTDYRTDP